MRAWHWLLRPASVTAAANNSGPDAKEQRHFASDAPRVSFFIAGNTPAGGRPRLTRPR